MSDDGVTLPCGFADATEQLRLCLIEARGEWRRIEITVTQCGGLVQVPFVAMREDVVSFVDDLMAMHDTSDPRHAELVDFTHQNYLLVGWLVRHTGRLFLEFSTHIAGAPSMSDFGVSELDSHAERYVAARASVDRAAGSQLCRVPAGLEAAMFGPDKRAAKKAVARMTKQTQEAPRLDGNSREAQAGLKVFLAGLHFDRAEIKPFADGLASVLL